MGERDPRQGRRAHRFPSGRGVHSLFPRAATIIDGIRRVSTESDAKGLAAWFDTWEGPLGYEFRDLTIVMGDDAAFCHSLNRLSGTKVGGGKNSVWLRQTLGFRKIGGEWKIAHQHESVPFYMDGSFKAAVDLKP
jgi:PhnB protein